MAREPELSIKVKVDPVINKEKLENDVQAQVSDIKKLPPVPIEPDTSGFKKAIKDNIGGPYPVEITPTLTKNLTQQVNDEIAAAQNGAQTLKVKLDVKDFGNNLSKQLKEQLRGVNRTLDKYLVEMQKNLILANKATNGLFNGGNRDVTVDSVYNEISKKNVKSIQTLTGQLDSIYNGLPDLNKSGKLKLHSGISSVEGFTSSLYELGTALQDMQASLDEFDETKAKEKYTAAFKKFENTYKAVIGSANDLSGVVNNPSALKNLGVKGADQLKEYLASLIETLSGAGNVLTLIPEKFDQISSVIDSSPTDFGGYASNIATFAGQISSSVHETEKELEDLKETTQKTSGAGVPIDPSILDANTKKIIESIGNVSAAMTELETKSKNFSDNLTVEVDKNVTNIESRVKQLIDLAGILPNGEENLLDGKSPKSKPTSSKKQNTGTDLKPEDKPDNSSNGSTATINKITFDVNIDELQKAVDTLFSKISAPIGFKPADGAIAAIKKTLEESLNGVEILNAIASKQQDDNNGNNATQIIPVPGHITITDADVSVKMNKPVQIPGEAIITPDTVRIGNAEDLQKNADAFTSIKKNLKGIVDNAGSYVTEISSVGPAFQYVASELDNLNRALSEQVSDFDKLSKKIDNYIEKTGGLSPVELNGRINVKLDDIIVPKKIPLNGELQIANATKEIKEATTKAQPKQSVSKNKNGLTDRNFERKSKELLTSLASIMKGKARVQNSLTNHNRKGQTEAEAEDAGYLANLSRRERTTKSKLTKLYKGHGGRSAWQSDSIYHSAVEDSEHIRNSRVAENSDKDKAAAEEKYIAALRQRPKLYKEIATAKRKYGNDSEYVKSAQKELQNTLNVIGTFESKVGKQYLQSMSERRNALEENMSDLRKNREDKQKVNAKAQTKADDIANKARINSEKEFLENLAKEPKLWADVEEARKKYGNNSAEAKQAEYLKDKNKSVLDVFKTSYNGSLSDIPGYDDQIKENNLAMATYQSGMTRKENEAQQKQHNANQKAFQKRRENAAKQASDAQKAVEKSSADMIDRVAKTIEENKKAYLAAEKEIENRQKELLNVNDQSTRQDILDKVSEAKSKKKAAGHTINSFQDNYTGLVQNAWNDINSEKKSRQIAQNEEYEVKASKEAAATKKENLSILQQYNQELDKEFKLYKDLKKADPNSNFEDYTSKRNLFNDQSEKVNGIRKQIHDKGLNTSRDYQTATNRYYEKQAGFDKSLANVSDVARIKANNDADAEVISSLIDLYKQLDSARTNRVKLFKDEDIDKLQETDNLIQKLTDDIENLEAAAQYSGIDLSNNDSYMAAFERSDKVRIDTSRDFDSKRVNYVDQQTSALMDEYRAQVTRMQNAGIRREQALGTNLPWKANQFDSQYNEAKEALKALDDELQDRGLSLEKEYLDLLNSKAQAENVVAEAVKARAKAEAASVEVTNNELNTLQGYRTQISTILGTLRKNNAEGSDTWNGASAVSNVIGDFYDKLSSNVGVDGNNKHQIAVEWANANGIKNVKDYQSAIKAVNILLSQYRELAGNISSDNTFIKSITKAKTEFANLQSEFDDYIRKYPKVEEVLTTEVQSLRNGLSDPQGWANKGALKQQMAELRVHAKKLRLETTGLLDVFEKLFGQHLSTMITMAALHKIQESLQQIYQNVVEIDSAMTELRKVTNLTASGYEEFMDRAADKAQKLGISISDFINSTADWARLGYNEQEAEELARVSSLLKNVGDGIESASDASAYLISALQGFGLAADQASEFLDVLNQIANTEPVTANDLGIIMQKSSAAMNAAGNTYQETMAMAAAVNGVLQDSDVSGTYLKTLSMYLRAAKTDAENAGIEIDGMASSVSELRNELKQLTGVDIMSDAAGKNFKSTYQIMKELSQVWNGLSDVTQANVTKLISGKRGGQATSALLNNFKVAEDAMKQASNAAGSALAENSKYLDSIQGRLAQLDASFQSLSTHVLDSGIVKYAVSFLTTIVKITDNITKLSGALPPIAAAVSGILSVMQMNGKLENGAGKVNMPAYARCA
nr:MAG TPA: minor tail protein [Caudoviricetes sp.]